MSDHAKISVVDDDEAVRDALGSLLSALGYRVQTFESATAFIEDEGIADTACLITDVQMPGMTGLELLEHLSASGSHIPVIVVSAHGQALSRARARRSGAVAWLEKPVRQERLVESIDYALSGAGH